MSERHSGCRFVATTVALFAIGACSGTDYVRGHVNGATTSPEAEVVVIGLNDCGDTRVPRLEESEGAILFEVEVEETRNACTTGVLLCLRRPFGDRSLVNGFTADLVEPTFDDELAGKRCSDDGTEIVDG